MRTKTEKQKTENTIQKKDQTQIKYRDIVKNEEIRALITKGNEKLGMLGYTDHSEVHGAIVAKNAAMILKRFGYPEHEIELVKIAGFMHDIGNSINRSHHAEYGAILAGQILEKLGMPLNDRVSVMSAIGNHDESTGGAYDPLSAALIIADKTDVRRDRVRSKSKASFDIHDRVNYAVTEAKLKLNTEKAVITLDLAIDESMCTMYEYFDVFLDRMIMCRGAAEILNAKFKLMANGSKVL